MTFIFIHGVPDTERVWKRLAPRVAGDGAVLLSLPGFGRSLPAGFASTKEDYLAWLIAALEAQPPPRDVVAHDWGSILMMRVLSVRPDLIRSWVGGGAPMTPDYTWHATARLWQTPGAGEKSMQRLTPEIASAMLSRAGLEADDALETASHIDDTMKNCILNLYRSGRDVFQEWGPQLAHVTAPGLVVWGERDAYAAPAYAERIGEATGARVAVLPCGHWWQLEQPDAAADAILAFQRSLGI